MNNSIGVQNACGGFNGESLMLILFLLMFMSPGMIGGAGSESLILILFLLMFMPNFGMGRNFC